MTEEQVSEHNRLFQEAVRLVQHRIAVSSRSDRTALDQQERQELQYASVLFERVLSLNSQNWPAAWFMGKVYQRLGDHTSALLWFTRAYGLNPSQADVAREASIAAMEIGEHETAIRFAERAVSIRPTDPGLHANLALADLLAGRLAQAKHAIERALLDQTDDTASTTLKSMIDHFAMTRENPPPTTSALLHYWRRSTKGNR